MIITTPAPFVYLGGASPCPPAWPPVTTGRADVLRQRGQCELHELAADLHQRGTDLFELYMEVGRRAALLRANGAPLPPDAALSAVRALPGLDTFDPMAAWQQRVAACDPDALAEGIDPPDEEERQRRRRAEVTARWMLARAGSAIVEEVVQAAEAIAQRHAREEVENV